MAAPTGKEGSAELVCQAALPAQGVMIQGSPLVSNGAAGSSHAYVRCK